MTFLTNHNKRRLLKDVRKFVKKHFRKLTEEEYLKRLDSIGEGGVNFSDAYEAYISTLPTTHAKYMEQPEFASLLKEAMAYEYGVTPWNTTGEFRPFKLININKENYNNASK